MAGIVGRSHGKTARDAADSLSPTKAAAQRFRILQAIGDTYDLPDGEKGLTRDELSKLLDMLPNSVQPRCNELIYKKELLAVAPYTREAIRSDKQVEVLLLTPEGAEFLLDIDDYPAS